MKLVDNLSLIACLAIAMYYTTIQFVRYGKNEDLSVVQDHHLEFALGSKDNPPTYSICLFAPNWGTGSLYKPDSHHWKQARMTSTNYRAFLRGSSLFKGAPEGKTFEASEELSDAETMDIERYFSGVRYEEVVIDLFGDIISSFSAITKKDGDRSYEAKFDINSSLIFKIKPMIKTHQSSEEVCYTRTLDLEKGRVILEDRMHLNVSKLFAKGLGLNIYVHERGQLIRHLTNSYQPAVTTFVPPNVEKIQSSILKSLLNKKSVPNEPINNDIEFKIDNVVISRKRNTERTPCDNELMNEDRKWQDMFEKTIGCAPAYWKIFASNSTSTQNNETSCSPGQYQSYYQAISFQLAKNVNAQKSFYDTAKYYKHPCTAITRNVFSKKSTTQKRKNEDIYLRMIYGSETYMEIQNLEAYNGETLLGQVGGFIGV